eukprot:1155047-Pelagomonas_calceolata.AAC.3
MFHFILERSVGIVQKPFQVCILNACASLEHHGHMGWNILMYLHGCKPLLKGKPGVGCRCKANYHDSVLRESGDQLLQCYWFCAALKLHNSILGTTSSISRCVVQADLELQFKVYKCWTAQEASLKPSGACKTLKCLSRLWGQEMFLQSNTR